MSGIQLKNQNQFFIPFEHYVAALSPTQIDEDGGVRKQPTADKDALAQIGMWFHGKVIAFVLAISEAGIAGDSTDNVEQYWIRNAGIAGAGTVIMTNKLTALDTAADPDVIPAAGTILRGFGISGADGFLPGDILELQFDTTGTIGTGTLPIVTPLGIVVEAWASINPLEGINQSRT